MNRRGILYASSGVLVVSLLGGCFGNGSKRGYLQAEITSNVPSDTEIVEYSSINWENKEMVQQVVRGAYDYDTSSVSVEGDKYKKAEEQLKSLDSSYIEYRNATIVVYLTTEQQID